MIEKKTPKVSGTVDLDDGTGEAETAQVRGPHDEAPNAGAFHEDAPSYGDEADSATSAMTKQNKQKGLLLTYGVGAVFFGIVFLLAYPHFKHYFVSAQPQQVAGIPVPDTVRSHHFQADAPGGAVSGGLIPPPAPAGQDQNAPPQGMTAGSAPIPAIPATPAVPATVAVPEPSASPAPDMQAKLDDLSGKLSALQATVDGFSSQKDATAAQIQQMQTGLDNLQRQVADLATAKAPSRQSSSHLHHGAAPAAAAPADSAPRAVSGGGSWVLRSAMPGMALIGHAGSNELQRISPGDLVSGLGRITSIKEQNGQWVVQGTNGSVGQ